MTRRHIAPPFLASALDGGEWLVSCPGRFTPDERAPVLIGEEAGWSPEPVWTLWRREKNHASAGIRTLAVQSLFHRHTNWAIPTSMKPCEAYWIARNFLGALCSFNWRNPPRRIIALGFTQPLSEMSTTNLGVIGRPARRADNLTAICEPIF
jgi:hypothetical protein